MAKGTTGTVTPAAGKKPGQSKKVKVREPEALPQPQAEPLPSTNLTPQQQLFCLEYIKDRNATQAAKRAGYSEDTAYSQGARLLKNVEIEKFISEYVAAAAMGADEVLHRLAQQARGEQSEFLEPDGRNGAFVNLTALIASGKGHLIKTIKRDGKTGRITSVEFYDTQSALELMGRYHKLFTDKHEHSGPDGGPIPVMNYEDLRGLPVAERQRLLREALRESAEAKK